MTLYYIVLIYLSIGLLTVLLCSRTKAFLKANRKTQHQVIATLLVAWPLMCFYIGVGIIRIMIKKGS